MKITVITQDQPDTTAMLQALVSRNPHPLDELRPDEDLRASLRRYYIGYGHQSIGQCGWFTLMIENISMLAAKFIEHHGLFMGQETSTRYVDFSTAPFIGDQNIGEQQRALYSDILAAATATHGDKPGGKAFAFDIARCALSPGFATTVAWTTNFDAFATHCQWLFDVGDQEVQDIACALWAEVHARWPDAIAPEPDTCDYQWVHTRAFAGNTVTLHDGREARLRSRLATRRSLRALRPFGHVTFETRTDFAAWRDLSRHRVGWVNFPSAGHTLHPWYADQVGQLPGGAALLTRLLDMLDHPGTDLRHQIQGAVCRVEMHMPLDQAIYVAKLRSSASCHPTVRQAAQELTALLESHGIHVGAADEPAAGPVAKREGQTITRIE